MCTRLAGKAALILLLSGIVILHQALILWAGPDSVPEDDNYPPVRGMEAIPYEKLLKIMSGKSDK